MLFQPNRRAMIRSIVRLGSHCPMSHLTGSGVTVYRVFGRNAVSAAARTFV